MTGNDKLVVDPEQLTLRDLARARVMLEGRNPWEILEQGGEERVALVLWCLRSRTDPDFSWDDALDAPMGTFSRGDDDLPPPRGERNGSPPSRPGRSRRSGTTRKPPAPGTAPSSAPTSTSPETSSSP